MFSRQTIERSAKGTTMRRLTILAALLVAALLADGPAMAQSVNRLPVIRPPVIIIPPSMALTRALRQHPDAKPLGVKRKGNSYYVKLKKGNEVIVVEVDGGGGTGNSSGGGSDGGE